MARHSSSARRRRISMVPAMAVVAAVAVPLLSGVTASGQEATEPPNTFSLRLEGYAVETNTFSTATAVTPRSAYSFAKLNSVLDLDGGRGLDMEARGANDQYAGLEGAVIFAGDTPTDGNNLPGYAQAFFPTFEQFSDVSEKCATNQTEAREAPECRDQPGPYALARVVPDQTTPMVEGIGRNQGSDGRGDARSTSRVEPQPDGSIRGIQSNRGSDQGVPGTPITVDSYVAEQTVVATVGSAETDIHCEGEVSVAGQPVENNRQLQQALAPFSVGNDMKVTFEPATEPTVVEGKQGAGTLMATCDGPTFTVSSGVQGGTGTRYRFGRTFAAVGVTENAELGFGGGDGFTAPAVPDQPSVPDVTSSTIDDAIGSDGSGDEPPPDSDDETEVEAPPPATDEISSPDLVRRTLDSTPIGLLTAAAASLLPLGVWLLLGVTGSLARGLPALRLPPFAD